MMRMWNRRNALAGLAGACATPWLPPTADALGLPQDKIKRVTYYTNTGDAQGRQGQPMVNQSTNVVIVGEVRIANRRSVHYEHLWGGYRRYNTFFNNHPNIDANHINNYRYHINGPTCETGRTATCDASGSLAMIAKYNHVGVTGSLHPGGAQYCLGDGSVRFVSETVDKSAWAIATRLASGQTDQLP